MKFNAVKWGIAALLVFAGSNLAQAQDQNTTADIQTGTTLFGQVLNPSESNPVKPTILQPLLAPFSTGESGTRQLRLQISESLYFESRSEQLQLGANRGALGFSGEFGANISQDLSLNFSLQKSSFDYQQDFLPLGDIHCEGGILSPGSYHASNCYFIGGEMMSNRIGDQVLNLGTRWSPTPQFVVGLDYFLQQTQIAAGQPLTITPVSPLPDPLGVARYPRSTSPILPYRFGIDQTADLTSQTEGFDLNLQLGITTDKLGAVQLGLQFSHVLNSDLDLFGLGNGAPLRWSPAAPFNTAKVQLDWSKGPFSSGIQGFYREQMEFPDRAPMHGLSTFDIYFTWHTPWNANLSVGASNLLGSGSDKQAESNSEQFEDPFEMIYGRVPYVRYQQDL